MLLTIIWLAGLVLTAAIIGSSLFSDTNLRKSMSKPKGAFFLISGILLVSICWPLFWFAFVCSSVMDRTVR